jgi:hypothetical protein
MLQLKPRAQRLQGAIGTPPALVVEMVLHVVVVLVASVHQVLDAWSTPTNQSINRRANESTDGPMNQITGQWININQRKRKDPTQ